MLGVVMRQNMVIAALVLFLGLGLGFLWLLGWRDIFVLFISGGMILGGGLGLAMNASQTARMADARPLAPGVVPAAWYPDPEGSARQRYWDGSHWTDHFTE